MITDLCDSGLSPLRILSVVMSTLLTHCCTINCDCTDSWSLRNHLVRSVRGWHHCCRYPQCIMASEGRSVTFPWPHCTTLLRRSAGILPVSVQTWSTHPALPVAARWMSRRKVDLQFQKFVSRYTLSKPRDVPEDRLMAADDYVNMADI